MMIGKESPYFENEISAEGVATCPALDGCYIEFVAVLTKRRMFRPSDASSYSGLKSYHVDMLPYPLSWSLVEDLDRYLFRPSSDYARCWCIVLNDDPLRVRLVGLTIISEEYQYGLLSLLEI